MVAALPEPSSASHSGHSSKHLHAGTQCQTTTTKRKHLQMPLHQCGKKWANPAEQTTAHGFAFVFTSENEAVSVLDSG